jgi:polyribonucleotide nucleotidyltransferase
MASVCGGTLALMDAGVPIKRPVAGIAMGMLLDMDESDNQDDKEPVILSDILGTEDALGMMDFKVAGDREGITTFQLDIKCEGLTLKTMEKALEQARVGRLHILDKMAEVLPEPQSELPPTVPRLKTFSIEENSIGKVIGPGGKQIRAVIEDFGLTNMDVGEDGTIQISSMNTTALDEAIAFVQNLVTAGPKRGGPGGGGGGKGPRVEYSGPPPEIGKTYSGKITGIHQFGVFVEILPGTEEGMPGVEGLCHVSELHVERVRNCEAFMNSLNLETMEVKLLGKNDRGKWQLSRKAVLEDKLGRGRENKGVNGAGTKKPQAEEEPVRQEMEQGEIDAITKAIESVFDE